MSRRQLPVISLFVVTVLFMWAFHPIDFLLNSQFAYSQEEHNPVSDIFLSMNTIYGFLGAMITLIPIVAAVAYWLRRSVNASTNEFIRRQTEEIKDIKSTVTNQITSVNNNVNEKYNNSKDDINEIKETIHDIGDKLDKNRNDNTENRTRIVELDRRVGNLESSRFSSGPMSSMGIK